MQPSTRRSILRALAGGGLAGILALAGDHETSAAKKSQKHGSKNKKQHGAAKKSENHGSKNKQRNEGAAKKDKKVQKQDANVAEIMASALSIGGGSSRGGQLMLNEEKLAGLNTEQLSTIRELVSDINAGKLGIAVTDENGDVVAHLGSDKALDGSDGPEPDQLRDTDGKALDGQVSAQNALWGDGWGLHYYIDPYWTRRLKDGAASAISAITSAIGYVLCNYGAACLAYITVFNWVRFTLIPLLRRTRAGATTVHAPWNGNVYVQVGPYWYWTSMLT